MTVRAKRGRPPERPDRRESILRAAAESFVERGFYGTSIPEIAARADIAPGTIYHYFDSKEILVNNLYRTWKGHVAQRVLAAFPQGASPREQFKTIWYEITAFALAEPTAFAFIELHMHASYLDAESSSIDKNLKDFAAGVVIRAQQAGLVKSIDARVLMELIFGAFIGMMRASWEGRIKLDDTLIAATEQACWDAIAIH